uniref:MBL fold metallo-hydrolase n=1 Tax=Heterorhabditis bacteriophora TaxID=37862 RepID=A0A1I7WC49_HETBA
MRIWSEMNIRHLYEFAPGHALAITEKQGLKLMHG